MKRVFLFWFAGLMLCSCENTSQPTELPKVPPSPSPSPVVSGPSLPLEVEVEELRMIVRTLSEENRRLKTALEERGLQSLPPVRETAQPVPSSPPESQAVENETRASVLYVNPHWHYLIINQGSQNGIQAGRPVEIFRQETFIARANVTELKPGQAVAEIDLSSMGSTGLYPRKDDGVRVP